jgi:hypothetical protein
MKPRETKTNAAPPDQASSELPAALIVSSQSPASESPPAILGASILGALGEHVGYCAPSVECSMTQEQRLVLARLRAGLDAAHVRLANGQHVETNPQALRWLLEQIHFASQQ